jgi:hypothetical protein
MSKNSNHNPLVRFLRWVRKLLRSIFKSERQTANVNRQRGAVQNSIFEPISSPIIGLENLRQGRLITVGELFQQVQWKLTETSATEGNLPPQSNASNSNASLN